MENNLDLYRAKLPYPPIVVVKPNKHYAEIIQTSFAGAVSEFSAISQYIYHHLRTEDQYPEISKALESIAIVEMYHLEILGKLIIKLGGNPGYWINK
ncbi:manganese catalase family protein, partial [Clostridium sp.]